MSTGSKRVTNGKESQDNPNNAASSGHNRQRPPDPLALRALRLALRSLDRVAPRLSGRWVYRLWFSTHHFVEPKREIAWRTAAEQFTLPHEDGPLALYSWGKGPTVLLIHGWNGRGTQLGAFAKPLVDAGYRAVAFDAPAHGRTPGRRTNIFRIIDAVNTIEEHVGPLKGIVAHSFGAMVAARALRSGICAERVVVLCPAAQLRFLVDSFCDALQLPEATRKVFIRLFEKNFGKDIWEQISADSNARSLSVPALIIHDENDTEVPWQQGERLAQAWPGARFMLTRKLGHRRILRDRHCIEATVDFIARPL